ncbi:MAG: hypothetical protein ABI353_02195 [Isosphaeraceae bacterium]
MTTWDRDFNPYQAPKSAPEPSTEPKQKPGSTLIELAISLWIICALFWVGLPRIRDTQRSQGISIAEFSSTDHYLKDVFLGLPAALTVGLVLWHFRRYLARPWMLLFALNRAVAWLRRTRGAKET